MTNKKNVTFELDVEFPLPPVHVPGVLVEGTKKHATVELDWRAGGFHPHEGTTGVLVLSDGSRLPVKMVSAKAKDMDALGVSGRVIFLVTGPLTSTPA